MATFNPQLIGMYGLTSDHKYSEQGAIGLKCYKEPGPGFNFDLMKGFESNQSKYDRSDDHRDKLGNLVNWIANHQDKVVKVNPTKPTERKLNVDIVCEMGLLKSLLNMPYEAEIKPKVDNRFQKFAISKYKDVLFIKRIDVKVSPAEEIPQSYAGMRFEELVTESVDGNDQNGNECFSVLNVKVGSNSILYCCQVDCIKSRKNDPVLSDFVEIKTLESNSYQRNAFKANHSKKWWQQCIVSGASEIFVGIRNQWFNNHDKRIAGIKCDTIDKLKVDELPSMGQGWTPEEGINKLATFFDTIKKKFNQVEKNRKKINDPSFAMKVTITSRNLEDIEYGIMDINHAQYPVITKAMIEKLDQVTKVSSNESSETVVKKPRIQ